MAARLRLSILAGVLAALATAVPRADAEPASRTIEHQGVARSYLIANAADKAEPRPLMLVLHGRRAPDAPNRSSPPLDALAVREGFVAIYPAAIAGAWNYPTRTATSEIPLSMIGDTPTDDLGFLTRLIIRLVMERVADPARIYVSGASMGGFMTYALMCTQSERIAAAAPLIASMTDRQMETCKPARAVPVAMLAGTLDTVVPYEGRAGSGSRITSIPETMMFWSIQHECKAQTAIAMPAREKVEEPAISTMRIEMSGCRIDGALRLYRVAGGGHTLPSLRPQTADDRKRYGPRSTEFETSEEVWAFFKRFTRQQGP